MIIKRLELIRKKEFVAATLNPKNKVFVVYISSISQDLDVHPFWRAQIASLSTDEALTFISPKYTDFADVFCKNLVAKLLEYIGINDYAIDLIKG